MERYEHWCWRVANVETRPLIRIADARAKRERKSVKRLRDAELTRLGKLVRSFNREERSLIHHLMHQVRVGEIHPWEWSEDEAQDTLTKLDGMLGK